ncbi:MAG: fatty acid desaturase CarF family protein [Coxiellaceae bacterium]|nr:fatty acid desaturase CarF family protein [Coxiellaceae bacterium]
MPNSTPLKTQAFTIAIKKYNQNPWYSRLEMVASVIIILLQIMTTVTLFKSYTTTSLSIILITLLVTYIATDFINGMVHMIVDNNANYTSCVGPFIAAFHLHHLKLNYQSKHALKIYFYESGHKLWLVFYLLVVFILQQTLHLTFCLNLCLVGIGFLSSIAELSHFWCHNAAQTNAFIRWLQRCGILLSMQHHKIHHQKDNRNYAFLNGVTNPLLNLIASLCCKGYKNRSDKYIADYKDPNPV